MAKKTTPLTDREIKHAKPKDKEYSLADGQGLYLRVRPSGVKNWTFKYQRPFNKKRTYLGFGLYPTTSLSVARSRRDEARALLAQNIDPQQHKAEQLREYEQKFVHDLKLVATNWLEIKRAQVSLDHAQDIWRSLELHLFPVLGKIPVAELTPQQAIEALTPLASKGSLETVKRMTQRLNEVMNFAVNSGLLENNRLQKITSAFQPPKKQHMATLLPEQLPELMEALSYASIKVTTRILIEWQLHTMVRPSEAAGARWEEIDWEKKLWSIPSERMKSKRPHEVPLSPQAITLLERMKPISSSSEFIFPSDRDPRKPRNPETANTALKRMGFAGRLVAHGMRALASTTLNEHGFNSDVIESSLAHADKNEVRAAYNRAKYLKQRREMMEWWSDQIDLAKKQDVEKSA